MKPSLTEKIIDHTFILRFALITILIIHSVPGMFNGGVNGFGTLYLDKIGFAPFGLLLAWSIKLSHVMAAVLLFFNKYIKFASLITIFILVMGIIMIHGREGWFVVGGGRNGMEYNFLMICVFLYLMYPNGFKKQIAKN